MKKTFAIIGSALLLSSCVSRKLYNELDANYKKSLKDNEGLLLQKDSLQLSKNELDSKYKQLQGNYSQLEKNSDKAIKAEIARLNKLKGTLNQRSQQIAELEEKIASSERNLKHLKENLSKALNDFEGKGLTVEHKNGKVYVLMENKLLFPSGSWTISSEGEKAVEQLAEVLAKNPDISIQIEGHTDNDKVLGNLGGGITNNWDLSTKRATAIVSVMEKTPEIQRKNITVAGRSEYAPIAENTTPQGKAKNRRIEVVLTPKLEEISKMLNDI